jgi:hypothetical protein
MLLELSPGPAGNSLGSGLEWGPVLSFDSSLMGGAGSEPSAGSGGACGDFFLQLQLGVVPMVLWGCEFISFKWTDRR